MPNVSQRLAGLSPERRKLLEVLMNTSSAKGGASSSTGEDASADPQSFNTDEFYSPATDSADVKAKTRRFYDAVSSQLAVTDAGEYAFFLNFGYVPDGSAEYSRVSLPAHYLNKNCVRLVLELIGDCDVNGKRLLDAGCGRGGTVHVLKTFFRPAALIGVDLSLRAVSFCGKAHRGPRVHFLNGDAETLPFKSGSFDVITNVESSHSYPDIRAFYNEVQRLLIPGGYFLYTDLFQAPLAGAYVDSLRAMGFELERDRDITRNVLRSCDETARVHLGTFGAAGQHRGMNDFTGLPGSGVYESMRAGLSTYRILKLRKAGR